MPDWTHPLCPLCWEHETGRPWRSAYAVRGGLVEICCRCGTETTAGIYVRAAPDAYDCGGVHLEPVAGGEASPAAVATVEDVLELGRELDDEGH